MRRVEEVNRFDQRNISIHAPQWGATVGEAVNAMLLEFQSTHPSGVRQFARIMPVIIIISIHAPQWGATFGRWSVPHPCADFNPRTPVGCDPQSNTHQKNTAQFQSTHPSGVRPITATLFGVSGKFQSTHPSGVRLSTIVTLE